MVSAALAAAIPAGAPAAFARKEFPVHGGAGDITNASVCPVGHYVVGFRGRAGLWIDQIRIRCAPLLDGGGVGPSKALADAGGSGGEDQAEKCAAGHIVNEINDFMTDQNRQGDMVVFRCLDPGDGGQEPGYHEFGNPSVVRFRHYVRTCPDDEAAIGVNHR